MAEKKKKRKPRKIITTRHDDGTYSHEHMHDNSPHSVFAGTSQNMEDLKQHFEDHMGGPEEAAEAPETPQAPESGGEPQMPA